MSPFVPLRLLQTQTDARLVELARGGHERAFEALVQRHRKPLLAYCRRLLLPESRAEDALQQALTKAWLALRDGEEVREPGAWLYRIVHNTAISALRRSGYDYVELDESIHGALAPESDIDRRIAVREALAGLAALPEAQREVLLRTAVHGHSHGEVASALGLTDGAVRGLIYRARATLRTAVTAVTPPQLAMWAARAAEGASSHPQIGELVAGGGSAGMLGILLKGGAVVVGAGVLATGATLVQRSTDLGSTAHADPVSGLVHARPLSAPAPPVEGNRSESATPSAGLSRRDGGSARRRGGEDRRRGSSSGDARRERDSSRGGSGGGDGGTRSDGGGSGEAGGGTGTGSGTSGSGSDGTGSSSGGDTTTRSGSGDSGSGSGTSDSSASAPLVTEPALSPEPLVTSGSSDGGSTTATTDSGSSSGTSGTSGG